jgi:hypothetical protein
MVVETHGVRRARRGRGLNGFRPEVRGEDGEAWERR